MSVRSTKLNVTARNVCVVGRMRLSKRSEHPVPSVSAHRPRKSDPTVPGTVRWIRLTLMGLGSLLTLPVAADAYRPTLPEAIYFSSGVASGIRLCDRRLAEIQRHKFNQLYGERIEALYRRHPEITPEQRDVIHTSDCINVVSKRALRDALLRYNTTLSEIEVSYR